MMRASYLLGHVIEELRAERAALSIRPAPTKVQRTVERRGECAVIRIGNGGVRAWRKAKSAGTVKR